MRSRFDDENFMGEAAPSFDKADFEGTEITDEQLEKFNKAFEEYMKKLEETNECPMVMGKPVDIRPIPSTVDEFEKGLAFLNLPESATKFSDNIRDTLEQAQEMLDDAMEQIDIDPTAEDAEAKLNETMEKLNSEMINGQLSVLNKQMDLLEKELESPQTDLWAKFVCVSDSIFDQDLHTIFAYKESAERSKALVNRLESGWTKLAAMEDDKIGTSEKLRKDTATMLSNMQKALHDGEFLTGGEEDEKDGNSHKETSFAPKLC